MIEEKEIEVSNCKWCGAKLTGHKTTLIIKECDRCWELRFRIETDFTIATKIYEQVKKEYEENKQ